MRLAIETFVCAILISLLVLLGKSDATASGYRLTVTSAASGDTTTYTTVLTYKVKVPLFQFEREYQIKQAAEVN